MCVGWLTVQGNPVIRVARACGYGNRVNAQDECASLQTRSLHFQDLNQRRQTTLAGPIRPTCLASVDAVIITGAG